MSWRSGSLSKATESLGLSLAIAARRSHARAGVVRTDARQRRHAHLACREGRRRPGRRCTRRPGPWRGTGPWRGSGRRGPARCELAGRSRIRSAQCWWLSRGLHAFTAQRRSHAIGVHGLAPYRAAHRSAGLASRRTLEPLGVPPLSKQACSAQQRRLPVGRHAGTCRGVLKRTGLRDA